jgi:hypothetical protein
MIVVNETRYHLPSTQVVKLAGITHPPRLPSRTLPSFLPLMHAPDHPSTYMTKTTEKEKESVCFERGTANQSTNHRDKNM